MGTEGQTESWFPVRSGGKWGEKWGGKKVRKVGVGRQRFPARGQVFGVGPGCLNQGLSLSLGWGALLDSFTS